MRTLGYRVYKEKEVNSPMKTGFTLQLPYEKFYNLHYQYMKNSELLLIAAHRIKNLGKAKKKVLFVEERQICHVRT